jgi:hypothetical protein
MWALNDDAGNRIGYMVECPGCKIGHILHVNNPARPNWDFDGNFDAPTFSPSLLVHWPDGPGRPMRVCHSFIRNGEWHFLGDCTHALAGRSVPMVPVEET